MKECFAGATICEILQSSGMTILEAALKCKCFTTESMKMLFNALGSIYKFCVFISGDAIRIISAGGFYVNQNQTKNIAEVISPSVHMLENGLTLFRVGKKNYYIVSWLK